MFFKKKKPKIDPKIRFQNRQFNEKLHLARTFKRTAKPIPEGSFSRFLTQIGLGTIWRKILAIVIVGGLVYLVYIPNFLTWQTLVVEGMSDVNRKATEAAINDSLSSVKLYNPQRNLLFLSKRRITEAAMGVSAVDKIYRVDRDFKNKTVTVYIHSKYERFLVRSSDQIFDVYNDGTTKGQAGIGRDQWQSTNNPGMIKVDVNAKITNSHNREFLTSKTVQYIAQINEELKAITGSTLQSVKIVLPEFKQPLPPKELTPEESGQEQTISEEQVENTEEVGQSNEVTDEASTETTSETPQPTGSIETTLPLNAEELELIFQKGNNSVRTFRVIIDINENSREVVNRLNLLLSQTSPDRYNGLAYIDLRIPTRAFVCLINSPCTR